jgi:hypothetical protein
MVAVGLTSEEGSARLVGANFGGSEVRGGKVLLFSTRTTTTQGLWFGSATTCRRTASECEQRATCLGLRLLSREGWREGCVNVGDVEN